MTEAAMESLPNPVLVGLESLAQRSDPFFDGRPELRERAWFYRDEVYWRDIPGIVEADRSSTLSTRRAGTG